MVKGIHNQELYGKRKKYKYRRKKLTYREKRGNI